MVSELSVLIPVYNQPVLELVQMLQTQADKVSLPCEIRVYDDGSNAETKELNRPLSSLSGIVYKELPLNLGRTRIRKFLAEEASYNWLLFLDNDVMPAHQDFLGNYVTNTENPVAVGGVAYQDSFPKGAQLRWKYGKEREQATLLLRQQHPYERVFFSNLLVNKSLFLVMMQENQVQGYGHEDTPFAHTLQAHHIKVQHLDNPVFHLGLEPGPVFLEKTEHAIQNLVHLQKDAGIGQNSRLYKAFLTLRKWQLNVLVKKQAQWLLPLLRWQLTSKKPNLLLFDLYKLILYASHATK